MKKWLSIAAISLLAGCSSTGSETYAFEAPNETSARHVGFFCLRFASTFRSTGGSPVPSPSASGESRVRVAGAFMASTSTATSSGAGRSWPFQPLAAAIPLRTLARVTPERCTRRVQPVATGDAADAGFRVIEHRHHYGFGCRRDGACATTSSNSATSQLGTLDTIELIAFFAKTIPQLLGRGHYDPAFPGSSSVAHAKPAMGAQDRSRSRVGAYLGHVRTALPAYDQAGIGCSASSPSAVPVWRQYAARNHG